MKRGLLLVLCALLSACWLRAQTIPPVMLTDASGRSLSTSTLADHDSPFVISMWMTTCKPCIKELEALSDELMEWDGGFPLRIYAVSIDDSRSHQRALAMAKGGGWEGLTPLFDINGDLRRALNVSVVPQVFVYDAEGRLFYTHIGYRPGDETELIMQVRKCHERK